MKRKRRECQAYPNIDRCRALRLLMCNCRVLHLQIDLLFSFHRTTRWPQLLHTAAGFESGAEVPGMWRDGPATPDWCPLQSPSPAAHKNTASPLSLGGDRMGTRSWTELLSRATALRWGGAKANRSLAGNHRFSLHRCAVYTPSLITGRALRLQLNEHQCQYDHVYQ